jgi:hypothetical protein
MNTFIIIFQKLIGINHIIYYRNISNYNYWETIYKNKDNTNFLINQFISNLIFVKSDKFKCLNIFLSNIFINENDKKTVLENFSKSQKVYYSFSKFANIYRIKKREPVITKDLCMNNINSKQKNVFTLLQNNSIYLFSIYDLIKIINTSLINSADFFPKPLIPKNPYNNIIFNNSTLYNIYFFIKFNNFIIPPLLQCFVNSNLCLKNFVLKNEFIIREYSIRNYVNTSRYNLLYQEVIYMINEFSNVIDIDIDFPEDKLVEIFKPYLHLYYIYNYHISGTLIKLDSYKKLLNRFIILEKYNPRFGRKIIKKKNNKNKNQELVFNMDHPNFYDNTFFDVSRNYIQFIL